MLESNDEAVVGQIYTALRVRELEVEVARLATELDEARGGDSASGVSRFFTIAAATIDQAMVDVREKAAAAVASVNHAAQINRVESAVTPSAGDPVRQQLADELLSREVGDSDTEPNDQFQQFFDGDDDDGSRSWLLKSDRD